LALGVDGPSACATMANIANEQIATKPSLCKRFKYICINARTKMHHDVVQHNMNQIKTGVYQQIGYVLGET